MKNLTLFKGSTGKHSALNIYTNNHAKNEYKTYIMMEFRYTTKTQEVQGKKVGDFKDCTKVTFGMEMGSWHGEIGTMLRFFLKDPGVLKEKDGRLTESLLHKTPTAHKALYLWKFDNGGHYMGIDDRNENVKINISLSGAEMWILAEYIKAALQMYRYTDVSLPRSIEDAAAAATADAESQHIRPDQQPDDDLPF